ncbi:MAG: hypothetical protein WCP54_02385 [Actinomycetes bacterium]|jgi:hypothetical protein
MSALVWLLIPLVATVAATIYVIWKGRSRGPANPYTTISDHERFKKAFGTDEK